MLVRLLQKEFDDVVAVTDGQQAVDKVIEKPANYFSMIILDINMPVKDGVGACIDINQYFSSTIKGLDVQNLPQCASFAGKDNMHKRNSSFNDLRFRSNFSGENTPIARVGTEVIKKHPLIFALTSDMDSERVEYYVESGFHSVRK